MDSTGAVAAARLRALRTARRLSLRELSERLAALGHELGLSAISKIESGTRRMDVDDLTALAVALNVSPVTLLLPAGGEFDEVSVTGTTASAARMWMWATSSVPLPEQDAMEFLLSVPPWLAVLTEHKESGFARTMRFIEEAIEQDAQRKLAHEKATS